VIRDGLALMESHKRHGMDSRIFTQTYHRIVSEMLRCGEAYENYTIARYQDIVAAPREAMASIYRFVGLDLSEIQRVRFQLKSTVQEDGSAKNYGEHDRTLVWYELDDTERHLHGDVNRNQIANLSTEDKELFLNKDAGLMESLGYATQEAVPRGFPDRGVFNVGRGRRQMQWDEKNGAG
jgi:hypothetical protein